MDVPAVAAIITDTNNPIIVTDDQCINPMEETTPANNNIDQTNNTSQQQVSPANENQVQVVGNSMPPTSTAEQCPLPPTAAAENITSIQQHVTQEYEGEDDASPRSVTQDDTDTDSSQSDCDSDTTVVSVASDGKKPQSSGNDELSDHKTEEKKTKKKKKKKTNSSKPTMENQIKTSLPVIVENKSSIEKIENCLELLENNLIKHQAQNDQRYENLLALIEKKEHPLQQKMEKKITDLERKCADKDELLHNQAVTIEGQKGEIAALHYKIKMKADIHNTKQGLETLIIDAENRSRNKIKEETKKQLEELETVQQKLQEIDEKLQKKAQQSEFDMIN